MKSTFTLLLAGILLCLTQSDHAAEQILCSGILGNSGEQGASLVRFGTILARGVGVVSDESGSLWDRGGDGVLNRYAVDGRLQATYKISQSSPGITDSDRITRAGNQLLLLLGGKLYTLPLDAPSNTAPVALGIPAGMMSFGSVDGSVAIATSEDRKNWTVFLFNPATKQMTPLIDEPLTGLRDIELMPDRGLVAQTDTKLHLFRDMKEVKEGWPRSGPGNPIQFLNGYWYGSAWHGTIRRFNSEMEPDPGVVAGGGSGSFIGHVDGNTELEACRGLARIHDDLYAASGMNGILHLLRWNEDRQRFALVRRIGAVQFCQGLGINRQGQIWFNSGSWNWNDGPGDILHDCTSSGPGWNAPGMIGQLVVLPNDNFVAPEIRANRPCLLNGPFSWNVTVSDLPNDSGNAGFLNGTAVYKVNNMLVLLTINAAGKGKSYRIDASGKMAAERGPVILETATPVKEWTSLALKDNDTLLGAGDGNVIEMTRDGENWKEKSRWNSWKGIGASSFGDEIHIASDAGKLWVSDTKRHRILCFRLADGSPVTAFGTADKAGDDLVHLDKPCAIAVREMRAVVFDSGNQRLVKLSLSE